MRAARLYFTLKFKDWPLEKWKNVIFTDETGVVLESRRGKVHLWRRTSEKYAKNCIHRYWKKCTEFMFWGSFSYDKKGPCHIWKKETPKEQREAEAELNAINKAAEPAAQEEWELAMRMNRLNLRRKVGGRTPA